MVRVRPMSRRRWAIAAALVLVIAAIGGWWWAHRDGREAPDATVGNDAAAERASIVKDKHAARDRGDIDTRAASVSGRITRASDGAGIVGAIVLLTPKGFGDGSTATPGKQAESLHARTDAKGDYRIEHVAAGRFTLTASARGYLPARLQQLDVQAGHDNPDRDLQLTAGGIELRGTVTDIGGGAIEGALVKITRRDEGNMIDFGRAPSAVLTDDEGTFVISLPRGAFSVEASHPEYVAESASVQLDAPRTMTLVLTPGASIAGIVRALPDGAPVAGARVFANDADVQGGAFRVGGWGDARVVTDGDGSFELRGLSAGVRALTASSSTHASIEPVEVALGIAEQVSGVEIWVDRSFRITGFVVRRGAEREGGLEGVLVGGFSVQPPSLYVAVAPSAEDGYFEITGVRPGSYMIGAIGEEALPNLTGTSAEVIDADVEDLLVVMDPGATVRGRVQPPMPASVHVAMDGESMGFGQVLGAIANALVRTRSGDDGGFELRPVASGKLKLVAQGDDGSHGELSIELGSDDLADVVIEMHPRTQLAGRVEDAHGKPVVGVKVVATRVDGSKSGGEGLEFSFDGVGKAGTHETTTGEDGTFTVKGLEGGPYEVGVHERRSALAWARPDRPDQPDAPQQLEVPAERGLADVVLVVEARDGVIRGSVLDDQGIAIADAWVTAYREGAGAGLERTFAQGGPEQRSAVMPEDEQRRESLASLDRVFGKQPPVLTDEHGHFTIAELRAGSYTVVAEAERGTARAQQTAVTPGARISLRLAALGSIAGTVKLGDAAIDAVSISVEGPVTRGKQLRDPSGSFVIERLDPGHYQVSASGKQGVAHAELDVENGKATKVVLELEGYGTLRGIVVDRNGVGVGGLTVMAQGKHDMSPGAVLGMFTGAGPRTDDEGRFEIDEVPPGEGTVSFIDRDAPDGGAAAEVSYSLDGDASKDLGTITAIIDAKVPASERGELGLSTHVAKWSERPRAIGDDDQRPAPDELEHLWVSAVVVDGAADVAGVEPGDEIVAIDGQAVTGSAARSLAGLLQPHSVRGGQSVRVELDRAGSSRSVTMTARARTPAVPPK
jgi:Carboxypeptidase regulatory-like domain/PDZ domain